jgi:hypothetical protein
VLADLLNRDTAGLRRAARLADSRNQIMSTDAQQSDNTLKIVLIVVGAIVLLIGLIIAACAGIAAFTVRTVSNAAGNAASNVMEGIGETLNAQAVVEDFMGDVRNGQGAAAYANTSASFRKKQSQEQFQAFLDQHPELKNAMPNNAQPLQPLSTQGTMKFRSTFVDGQGKFVTITLDLVKEGQQWKVDAFTVK